MWTMGFFFLLINEYFDHLYKIAGYIALRDTQRFFSGKNLCADRVQYHSTTNHLDEVWDLE